MAAKKPVPEHISIRPGERYKGIVAELQAIAVKENRSLNSLILISLRDFIDNYKKTHNENKQLD